MTNQRAVRISPSFVAITENDSPRWVDPTARGQCLGKRDEVGVGLERPHARELFNIVLVGVGP
jgi:hypothetical protein